MQRLRGDEGNVGRQDGEGAGPSSFASDSTCRIALASGGLSSATGLAPLRARDLEGHLVGETTHVSQPGTPSDASSTSSSIASVAPPLGSVGAGARRDLARESDFTGTARTRTLQG